MIDPIKQAEIVRRLNAGEAVLAIMESVCCSRRTVRQVCAETGTPYPTQHGPLSQEKRAKIIERLRNGEKFRTISVAEHVCRKTIKDICYAVGIRPEPVSYGRQVVSGQWRETRCVKFKNIGMHRCESGHVTVYDPCPVCLALDANAECTPECRRGF